MKTLLTIKTDKAMKLMAQAVAEEIGVPLSTVINSFLKQFVRDREVTFSASYKPSKYLRAVIEESEKEFT
jgi:addiction module RelB/DinJ family antitoxin